MKITNEMVDRVHLMLFHLGSDRVPLGHVRLALESVLTGLPEQGKLVQAHGGTMTTPRDTTNYHLVSARGDDQVVIINPPKPMVSMTKGQALVFAAWIVALAEEQDGEFAEVLKAVQST